MAKQIRIDAKDECNVMIAHMAKAKGYTIMVYVFAALMLVYAFMGIPYTIVIPFVIAYLFIIIATVYYRLKFEKMQ